MDINTAEEQQENISFEYLPLHIITNTLTFLPVSDFLNACLTNKSWFEASLHKDITKKIVVIFDNCKFSSSNNKIKEFMNGKRYFSKLIFREVKFKGESDKFWIRFGKYIEDIEFCRCKMNQNKFFNILQFLPNLKRLSIDNTSESITDITLFDNKTEFVKDKIKKCLSRIDTLEFHSLEYLNDEIFEKFISFTNNIKYLTLWNCFEIIIPSSIVKFCKKNEESLIYLHFENEQFNQEEYLIGLPQLKKLKFKDFKIEIDRNCSDKTMDIFFKNQDTLEKLIIVGLNNQTMTFVCKYLKNLKHLEIGSSDVDFLPYINDLTKIEVLRLRGVNITSDNIVCEMFKDKKLMLRELQLHHSVTNKVLKKIYESCPNLEYLEIIFRHQIPHRGLQMIFKNLTKLKHLDFAIPEDDDDLLYDEDCELIFSIANLDKLRYLDLFNIVPFAGVTVKDIGKLKNLTTLNIDPVFKLTVEDIKHLAQSLNNIENIYFQYTDFNMTDEIINFITNKWRNLKSLQIDNCHELTQKSLICIAENCKNIKVLSLRSTIFSDPMNIIRKLQKKLPNTCIFFD